MEIVEIIQEIIRILVGIATFSVLISACIMLQKINITLEESDKNDK